MPVTGEVKTNPGKLEDPDKGFRSRFDKKMKWRVRDITLYY